MSTETITPSVLGARRIWLPGQSHDGRDGWPTRKTLEVVVSLSIGDDVYEGKNLNLWVCRIQLLILSGQFMKDSV